MGLGKSIAVFLFGRKLRVDSKALDHRWSMLQCQTENLDRDLGKMLSDLKTMCSWRSSDKDHSSLLQRQTEHLKSEFEKLRSEYSSFISECHFSNLQIQAENLKLHLEKSPSSLKQDSRFSTVQRQAENVGSGIDSLKSDFSYLCELKKKLEK